MSLNSTLHDKTTIPFTIVIFLIVQLIYFNFYLSTNIFDPHEQEIGRKLQITDCNDIRTLCSKCRRILTEQFYLISSLNLIPLRPYAL